MFLLSIRVCFVKLLVGIYVYTILYGCFPDYDTYILSDACFVNSFILHTKGSINMDMVMEMNSTPSPSGGRRNETSPYIKCIRNSNKSEMIPRRK
jgi:hypothetical protein